MIRYLKNKKTTVLPIQDMQGLGYSYKLLKKLNYMLTLSNYNADPLCKKGNIIHIDQVKNFVGRRLNNNVYNPATFTTPALADVSFIIQKLNTKAPGIDGITNTAIKHCHRQYVMIVVAIINAIVRLRHFPAT